jgi:hypothetical protein
MPRYAKVNNERSEAIELIKLMDATVKRNTWQIKSIGGESTLDKMGTADCVKSDVWWVLTGANH